ncbi:MAG TPA: ABC transporter substrate-binding protein, partial [Cellulomonadaceae bacterium]|nr:ABC transporter substrate-binding protein [Cellulomonadaceae bacterium]
MSKRTRTILAAALALSLVALAFGAAGCTPKASSGTASATDTPVKGGTLSYYINEPAYIDPYNTQESEGTNVEQSLFDSLTAINPLTSKLEPAAAESWKVNSDGTVWTFKLRKGATFH